MLQTGKIWYLVMDLSSFWGQMITTYQCGGVLNNNIIPPTLSHDIPSHRCNGLGAIAYDSRSTSIVVIKTLTGQRYVDDILDIPWDLS